MNNSLDRLLDGMAATLRTQIIPKLEDDFARGQAFGVIYMLNSIRLRAEWSVGFLSDQLALQSTALTALKAALRGRGPALPDGTMPKTLLGARALQDLRDGNDRAICDLIVWLADSALPADERAAIDAILDGYMTDQARHELKTSARPMFAEMSRGTEDA